MIHIHNAIICIVIAILFVAPTCYYYGKEKGFSEGYSQAEDVWKKTTLSIEKSAEDRIDIYNKEMQTEREHYNELSESYLDDDDRSSGLLEDY